MTSRSQQHVGKQLGPFFLGLVLLILGRPPLPAVRSVTAFVPCATTHHLRPLVCVPSTTTTELNMGLRSFLRKKFRRTKGQNDQPGDQNSSGPSSVVPDLGKEKRKKLSAPAAASTSSKPGNNNAVRRNSAPAATTAPSSKKATTTTTVRMGEDPSTGEIDVESRLGPETVQERIRRFKRGEMSTAEKEAYLKSALSTGNTPESRLPLRTGSSGSSTGSASPFPTDSILRNMARGNRTASSTSRSSSKPFIGNVAPSVVESQSKKRKYLDMVTNPHRFSTYKNVQQPQDSSTTSSSDDDDISTAADAETDSADSASARPPKVSGNNNNILNQVATELFGGQQQPVQSVLNDVQQRKNNLNDVPPATATGDFHADQARKKAERDKQQQEQLDRLRSLSSPLPARAAANNASGKKTPAKPRPSFSPQKPVNARNQSPSQSLAGLTKTTRNTNPTTTQTTTEIKRERPEPTSSSIVPETTPEDDPEVPEEEVAAEPTSGNSKGDSFFSRLMGGNKKASVEQPPPKASTVPAVDPPNNQPTPPRPAAAAVRARPVPAPRPAPAVARPAPPPAARKGPIRMELPILSDDDDDDDDEEPEMMEGMTIGEIMKRQKDSSSVDQSKRSKQWGVDMSRFQK